MLNDIERLEREIDTFFDNVSASNELMRIIKEIADEVVSQNNVLRNQSELLETAIKCIANLPKTVAEKPSDKKKAAVVDNNSELIKVALAKIIETQTQYSTALSKSHNELNEKIAALPKAEDFPKIPEIPQFPEFPEIPDFSELIKSISELNELTENIKQLSVKNSENSEKPENSDLTEITEAIESIKSEQTVNAETLSEKLSEKQSEIFSLIKQISENQNELFEKQKNFQKELGEKFGKQLNEKLGELGESVQKDIYEIFGRISEVNAELVQQVQNNENLPINEFVTKSEEFYRICYEIKLRQEENDRTNNALSEYVSEQMDKNNKRFIPVYIGVGLAVLFSLITMIMSIN